MSTAFLTLFVFCIKFHHYVRKTKKKRQIFYDSRHPYTEGLLNSVPKIEQSRQEKLVPIEGNPPDMQLLGSECPFSHRCGYAMNICARQKPPKLTVEEGHEVSCWKYYREMMESGE